MALLVENLATIQNGDPHLTRIKKLRAMTYVRSGETEVDAVEDLLDRVAVYHSK